MNREEQRGPEQTEESMPQKIRNRRVHMANERTFLAWIRTSIAIMAFGFVVEKFSLFVKQLGYYLGEKTLPPAPGYSSKIGILLVVLGVLMGVLAFVRYKNVEKQIDADTYRPSPILSVLLFLSVLAIGVFLILYLVHTL
jgi:putative membrane protein